MSAMHACRKHGWRSFKATDRCPYCRADAAEAERDKLRELLARAGVQFGNYLLGDGHEFDPEGMLVLIDAALQGERNG